MQIIENEVQNEFIATLKNRFEKNIHRHPNTSWSAVLEKIENNPIKLQSLYNMEITGGEPDVVDYNVASHEFIFVDCSPESPKGRRSICYDHEALHLRKEHKPENSAIQMAFEMGIELLDEISYRKLQHIEAFDKKTSSWLATPIDIRNLGGAIFGDYRYGNVFIYHNGADS